MAGIEPRPRWVLPAIVVGLTTAALLVLPPVRDLFVAQGVRWTHVLLLSCVVALGMTPLTIFCGHRWGLVDLPAARKIHVTPTPRVGGVALAVGVVVGLGANQIVPGWMSAILVAGFFLLVVGMLDDTCELPAWSKLVAQVLASGYVMAAGSVLTLFSPGPAGDLANAVVTLLWLVGITNAFNFFDGMDGLATGLAALIAFFLGAVAFQTDQPGLGWVAVAVIGASLGFLPYNFRVRGPALVFLGDGGATFLGFTLAALAVKGQWADHNPIVSFSNPLLIFGILIYDMIHITVDRILTGKVRSFHEWISFVGKDHLHHRLERALGSRRASVAVILALSVCLGLAALVLRRAGTAEALMLLAQAALIVIIMTILEQSGRNGVEHNGAVRPQEWRHEPDHSPEPDRLRQSELERFSKG